MAGHGAAGAKMVVRIHPAALTEIEMEIKTELEKLSKEGLVDLTGSLAWNDAFGCFTRAGFEKLVWPQIGEKAEWIIYFDINGMHALNELHGSYDPVDAMIKNVLAVTRATDFVAGQWKSGDEFLVCVTQADDRAPVDPQGMVNRLAAEMQKQGLSATFAIVPVVSWKLAENVEPAIREVYAAKKARGVSR